MTETTEPAAIALSAGTATATRFAPSPSGDLHIGNARTALFSFLLARKVGGRFVLRIEDTDAARSTEEFCRNQQDDLVWLGLEWDAGPGREDARGPYRQSERAELYAEHLDTLDDRDEVYECFCTPLELAVARKNQMAAGQAPRYPGTCRDLAPEERIAKRSAGLASSMRFRVPSGKRVDFVDFVRGPQSFLSDDIGDFVVRRADGTTAFFFSNAVDDSAMGITHVLRGEDHLSNTPRQILILQALHLPIPSYGHVSLLVGTDGAKLSKRHGATSVREFRELGYTAAALCNQMFRLGHSTPDNTLLQLPAMAQLFDPAHLGKAPAHFDMAQLQGWQKDSVKRMSKDEMQAWLTGQLPVDLDPESRSAFIEAVRANIVLPDDARAWQEVVFGGMPAIGEVEQQTIDAAGKAFFAAAAEAAAVEPVDFKAITAAAGAASGATGKGLYQPLRIALTGMTHGPELAPLLRAMPQGVAQARLKRFA